MERAWMQRVTVWCAAAALLCWTTMFLAGTDVWHDAGRPDFWSLPGPPNEDLRAFAYAFYVLLMVLTLQMIVAVMSIMSARRNARACSREKGLAQ